MMVLSEAETKGTHTRNAKSCSSTAALSGDALLLSVETNNDHTFLACGRVSGFSLCSQCLSVKSAAEHDLSSAPPPYLD